MHRSSDATLNRVGLNLDLFVTAQGSRGGRNQSASTVLPEKKKHGRIGRAKRSREVVRRAVVAAGEKIPAVSRHFLQHPVLTIAATFKSEHGLEMVWRGPCLRRTAFLSLDVGTRPGLGDRSITPCRGMIIQPRATPWVGNTDSV